MQETVSSVVVSVHVSDIYSSNGRMPLLNNVAWKTAQHDCNFLRCTYTHLLIFSMSNSDVLTYYIHDPFLFQKDLIIALKKILAGFLTGLHLHSDNASKHQLSKLFSCYIYGIGRETAIKTVIKNCIHCNSLKYLPKEIME